MIKKFFKFLPRMLILFSFLTVSVRTLALTGENGNAPVYIKAPGDNQYEYWFISDMAIMKSGIGSTKCRIFQIPATDKNPNNVFAGSNSKYQKTKPGKFIRLDPESRLDVYEGPDASKTNDHALWMSNPGTFESLICKESKSAGAIFFSLLDIELPPDTSEEDGCRAYLRSIMDRDGEVVINGECPVHRNDETNMIWLTSDTIRDTVNAGSAHGGIYCAQDAERAYLAINCFRYDTSLPENDAVCGAIQPDANPKNKWVEIYLSPNQRLSPDTPLIEMYSQNPDITDAAVTNANNTPYLRLNDKCGHAYYAQVSKNWGAPIQSRIEFIINSAAEELIAKGGHLSIHYNVNKNTMTGQDAGTWQLEVYPYTLRENQRIAVSKNSADNSKVIFYDPLYFREANFVQPSASITDADSDASKVKTKKIRIVVKK